MLESLEVRDFARFARLSLQFPDSGFCALTGETGAGKSLLLGALAAALGGRFPESSIRNSAKGAEVAATFALSDDQARLLADCGHDFSERQLLLRRVIERGRRVRNYLNDSVCTAAQARQAAAGLIAVFGQHEHMLLRSAASRREMLDRFAGCNALADKVASCHRAWSQAAQQLAQVRARQAAGDAERERLSEIIGEADESGQNRSDYENYSRMLTESENAAELAELHGQLVAELKDADAGCRRARQALERIGEIGADPDSEAAGLVAEVEALAADALRAAEKLVDQDRRHDPATLAEAESYVSETHRLMRRHHCVSAETLFEYFDEVRAKLAELGEDSRTAAGQEEARMRQAWQDAAAQLGRKRRAAAGRLSKQVSALIGKLGMDGGRFAVQISAHQDDQPRPEGGEQIDFAFAARSREQLRRVDEAASGGELSRLALALYSLCGGSAGQALVFDEIDTGVGGRIAAALGSVLSAIGSKRLVLAVTHLPQVAAAADWHWQVGIGADGAATVTRLQGEQRAEEIARMLAGKKVTEASRRNAAEIIESARAV